MPRVLEAMCQEWNEDLIYISYYKLQYHNCIVVKSIVIVILLMTARSSERFNFPILYLTPNSEMMESGAALLIIQPLLSLAVLMLISGE